MPSLPVTPSTAKPPSPKPPQHVEAVTSQKSPVAQLLLSAQVEKQVSVPQAKIPQLTGPGVTQVPCPSQRLGPCWRLPVQLWRTEPHATVAGEYLQAPVVASQSVAPQVSPVLMQVVVQQCPLPLVPQIPDSQSSFSVHRPSAILATQTPALQLKPLAHPDDDVQLVAHVPASPLQPKCSAQGEPAPGVQTPSPSQLLRIDIPSLQEPVPQERPAVG